MEKIIKIEEIDYTFRTRTVKEGKALRNAAKDSEDKIGDLQVQAIMSSLKVWSRPEVLNQDNFENLTPDSHLGKLFEAVIEVNTLPEPEKNASSGQSANL